MEHLSNALKALFAKQDGDYVLYNAGIWKKNAENNLQNHTYLDVDMNESHLMSLLKKASVYNTLDQQIIVGQVILSQWMAQDYDIKN